MIDIDKHPEAYQLESLACMLRSIRQSHRAIWWPADVDDIDAIDAALRKLAERIAERAQVSP